MKPAEFIKKISEAIVVALKQAYDSGYKQGFEAGKKEVTGKEMSDD